MCLQMAVDGALIEFVYFLAITVLSLSIYLRTKQMYLFSHHRGIGYFRNAFLFFSLVYIFRLYLLLLPALQVILGPDFWTSLKTIGSFLVIYFSLLSILNLMSSFAWKRIKIFSDNVLNLSALFLSCIIFFIKVPLLLFVLGVIAVEFLILKGYDNYKSKGSPFSKILLVYTLLLFFWFFDLVPFIHDILSFELLVAGYLASVGIFVYLVYRVQKVFGPD